MREWCSDLSELLDEAQLEVTRSSVKWKVFKIEYEGGDKEQREAEKKAAEKAAKAFKAEQTDKVWSDVGHTDKAYYVGYCRAGELATMAVKQAGEYYKLNVELTAGYMLGTNWATCH